jgi:flagellum-specific ATP synthase
LTDTLSLAPYFAELDRVSPMRWTGRVTELVGLLVESHGPNVAVGDFCELETSAGRRIRTQVIGFRNGRVLSMPLEEIDGLQLGDPGGGAQRGSAGGSRAGTAGPRHRRLRQADGRRPAHRGRAPTASTARPNPLDREHITEPLVTGIRAIDGLLPCGKGQRIGIFGGSGVGKSTLLGSMSRHNSPTSP